MALKDYIPLRDSISLMPKMSGINLLFIVASLVLIGVYLFGVVGFLQHGHHAYNVTREHPWGFLVSAYEFFVALSMGTIAIAASGVFFDIKALKPIVKRALVFGLLALISGFAVFLFEIGHPITMVIQTALSGHPTSALFWLGVFYPLTMLFTFLTFIMYNAGKNAKIYAMFALIFANSSILTAGSIFGLLNNNPFSTGVFYPIEFLLSGILGGIFLFSIIAKFFIKDDSFKTGVLLLKEAAIAIASLLLIMYLIKFLTAIYGNVPGKIEVVNTIMLSPTFWLLEVLLGIAVPLVIAIWGSKEQIGMFCMASVLGLIGLMAARINVVEAVQVVPKQLMKTSEYQLPPTITHYSPSLTEWAIGIGAIGIFMLLMYLAEKFLKLD
jgi:molybdopterin-containing oxidoreductase family membrane subunit